MIERQITLGEVQFTYHLDCDWAPRIAARLAKLGPDRFVVVTDDTVLALHGKSLVPELEKLAPVTVLSRPPGEAMKSLTILGSHLDAALSAGATRNSIVVAFGGGVPGNLAGMVAALMFRGIRLVHVPTTTMAAADSVISLKHAVNGRRGKHHIGTYYRPDGIYLDLAHLQTLPEREIRSGLCEAAKNCLAIRPRSLPRLRQLLEGGRQRTEDSLRWLIEESLTAKLTVLEHDATERRGGLVLEYGHTVGHAVEFCDQVRRGSNAISHGEAIAVGMVVAARVASRLGYLGDDVVALHEDVIDQLGVRPHLPTGLELAHLMAAIRADNKRGLLHVTNDEIPMILLEDLGQPRWSADGVPLAAVPVALLRAEVARLQLHPSAALGVGVGG